MQRKQQPLISANSYFDIEKCSSTLQREVRQDIRVLSAVCGVVKKDMQTYQQWKLIDSYTRLSALIISSSAKVNLAFRESDGAEDNRTPVGGFLRQERESW